MKKIIPLILCLIFFAGCAKVVTPTGGSKDITPPVALRMDPPNRALNFNAKRVKITFNEFVELINPTINVLTSPPFAKPLKFSISGKSVIVDLTDTLHSNTTYNLLFINCIKDYTEGNLIPLLQYSFATGDSIDSYSYSGKIVNAETLEPEPNILIFLYKNNIDSLPTTKIPDYLTQSQKNGKYCFENIAKGSYKIFALKDINSNLIFDLPNESIAFQEDLIEAVPSITFTDTLNKDTTNFNSLFLFLEADSSQALFKYLNPQKGEYRFPYKKSFNNFQEFFYDSPLKEYLKIINPSQDTVTFYFKEDIGDSLRFIFVTDDTRKDTVLIKPYKSNKKSGRGNANINKETLQIKNTNLGELYLSPTLNFSTLIRPLDSFPATIVKKMKSGNDTIKRYFYVKDSVIFSISLPYPFEEKSVYSIMIRDSLFYDFSDKTNDSLTLNFTVKSEKDYGNILINYRVSNPTKQYIALLINEKGGIIQKDLLLKSEQIVYKHLKPDTYRIKLIVDDNQNGKWDSGNYHKKSQPEKIIYFKEKITVRGFWDIEENFEIPE